MRVHADYAPLSAFPRADLSDLAAVARTRAAMAAATALRPRRVSDSVTVEDRTIEGPGGPLGIRLYRPQAQGERPAMLYLHGGGFVLGDLDTEHDRCIDYAEQAGCVVLSVDYRLAPEHPFPAASDDALAALAWLDANAQALGVDRERLALGGGSAGGALAAGLALRVRDAGGPQVAFVLLVQPALDHVQSQPSAQAFTDTPFLRAADLAPTWRAYLGAAPPKDERLSWGAPFAVESLVGFPPTCMIVGAADPVRDEDLAFARRLIAAGVEVELHLLPGTPHGFDLVEDAQITRDALAVRVAALDRAFNRQVATPPPAGGRGVLAAACVGMALSILPVFAGTFPVFLGALGAEGSALTRVFPSLLLIAAVAGSLANLAAGWAIDRYGPRRVALPGVVLFGAAIASLSLADRVGAGVFGLAIAVGAASALCGPVVYAKAVSGWFSARRGAALSLSVTAAPLLSMALTAPLAAMLVEALGWRGAYVALGGGVAAAGLCVLGAGFRDPPVAEGNSDKPDFGMDFGAALSGLPFWLITLSVALGGVVATAASGQMLVVAQELGFSRAIAVSALSAMAGAGLLGALAFGIVIDRLGSPRIVAAGFAPAFLGVALLRHGEGPVAFVAGCALLGVGNFAVGSALPYLMARFFGLRRMGEIFGACAALVAILSATGPMLFGLAQAHGLGVATVLDVGLLGLAAAALLLLPLRRYPDSFEAGR